MAQQLIVGLIVAAAAFYAVWRWMPAGWRAAARHEARGRHASRGLGRRRTRQGTGCIARQDLGLRLVRQLRKLRPQDHLSNNRKPTRPPPARPCTAAETDARAHPRRRGRHRGAGHLRWRFPGRGTGSTFSSRRPSSAKSVPACSSGPMPRGVFSNSTWALGSRPSRRGPMRWWCTAPKGGPELARMPLADAMQQRYGAPYFCVHRADLHGLLLDAVRAAAPARSLTGAQIGRWKPADDRVCLSSTDARAWEGQAHRSRRPLEHGAQAARLRVCRAATARLPATRPGATADRAIEPACRIAPQAGRVWLGPAPACPWRTRCGAATGSTWW